MKVGCPKEIKVHEYRVGLTPESAAELVRAGHEVFLETKAGEGIGAPDSVYEKVGVKILPNADAVFEQADMIVKVKEPQAAEYRLLREDQILFTYLHLAAGALQNVAEVGPAAALTGPVARGDWETVARHLAAQSRPWRQETRYPDCR